MNSERYHAQFEQRPDRYTKEELVAAYKAGLPLTVQEQRDVGRILKAASNG